MIKLLKKILNTISIFLFGKVIWNLITEDSKEGMPDQTPASESSKENTDIEISEEKKDMSDEFVFNTSIGKPNYSQRKSQYVHIQKGQYGENKIDWTCLCNSHALIMAFLYAGWTCPASSYEREPDAFADFVVKECLKENNWFKTKMYNLWEDWFEGRPDAYSPLELHEVLAHYAREWFKSENADTFKSNANLKDIFKQLYENKISVPTSVQWCKLAGHVITIVGFKSYTQNSVDEWLSGVYGRIDPPFKSIIIDDPWGRPIPEENRYDKNQSGNDVEIPFDIFMKAWKPINDSEKKFAHFIGKPVSLV